MSDASSAQPPEPPVRAQVVYEPARRQRGSGVGRLLVGFLLLVVLAIGGLVLLSIGGLASLAGRESTIKEKHHSLKRGGSDKVAIINVEGTILDGEFAKKQIDRIRKDDAVKAVVLRIDSPGGTVTASDYIHHHLRKLVEDEQLPMVVSMGGVAASGGYYVAMAVGDGSDVIYAEPTTWTGSIGVIIPHYNLAGLLERLDIVEDSVKSHPLKGLGSPFKEMTSEERAILQELVDDGFARFKQIVRSGRPALRQNEAALDRVATGQVFTTAQAIKLGLVDKEGFIEEAIERAIELAGIDKDDTEVVEYEEPFSLFGGLLAGQSRATMPWETVAGALSPRAWYLFAWPAHVATGSHSPR